MRRIWLALAGALVAADAGLDAAQHDWSGARLGWQSLCLGVYALVSGYLLWSWAKEKKKLK